MEIVDIITVRWGKASQNFLVISVVYVWRRRRVALFVNQNQLRHWKSSRDTALVLASRVS